MTLLALFQSQRWQTGTQLVQRSGNKSNDSRMSVVPSACRNYNLFHAAVCRKKIPVVLVVTGLENSEGDMENWWTVTN
ncbi:hypothetical protein JVU11DRAFT_8845 [Chiua virens]|nr:hypothetical protein JVU11DRAFT_8845 [Chiua virens]